MPLPVNDCDILSNSKLPIPQPLTEWVGDLPSLIGEMKRRAGVKTDQDLARFLGAAQSTISNWRQRGAVPQAALFKFEEALATTSGNPSLRALFARCVALRVPEVWYQRVATRSSGATREVPYLQVASSLNAIVAEIASQMVRIEKETGLTSHSVMERMLEDETFLAGVIDWLNGVSAADLVTRNIMASLPDAT